MARIRGRWLSNALDAYLEELKTMPASSFEVVEERIRDYFQVCLNKAMEHATLLPTDPLIDIEREKQLLDREVSELKQKLAAQAFDDGTALRASEVLENARRSGPLDTDATRFARMGVMRADIESRRILRAMLEADFGGTTPLDPLFAGMAPTGLPPLPGEEAAPSAAGLSLAAAANRYIQQHVGSWVAKTTADQQRVCSLAGAIIGEEKPLREIGTPHVIAVRDALSRLPPNYMKAKANQGVSLSDVIASNRTGPAISVKTQDKYFGMFRSFLIWAQNEELIDKLPGAKVKVTGLKTVGREDRDPYSPEQLKSIFTSPAFTGHTERSRHKPGPHLVRDGKFWVPLIALYSGMRLGEIVQLLAGDIKQDKGIRYFDVSKGEDKTLKTGASARRIPVHSALIDAGFLDHVGDRLIKSRIFPDIEKGQDGYYSHNLSKWWGRYSQQVGFKTDKTAFHSFRHTFTDALYAGGAAERIAMALLGHTDKKVHSHYGSGPQMAELKEAIERVSYDLDLTFLKP
nr:site-specific integrase [Aurantimonas sp. 22II-16-19i]